MTIEVMISSGVSVDSDGKGTRTRAPGLWVGLVAIHNSTGCVTIDLSSSKTRIQKLTS